MKTSEEIIQYLDLLKSNHDNYRRLLRLTLVDNRRFKKILDFLIDGIIDIKFLDRIDISSTRELDEALKHMEYIDTGIGINANLESSKYIMDNLGGRNLIDSIKITEGVSFDNKFNEYDISNFTNSISIGENDTLLGYKDYNEFHRKVTDPIYSKVVEDLGFKTYRDSIELEDMILGGINSGSILYDDYMNEKVKGFIKYLFGDIPTSEETYVNTFFRLNKSFLSRLEIHSEISNFILNFTLSNKYLIYYLDELISEHAINGRLSGELIYDKILKIDLEYTPNLYQSFTKLYVYSYILSFINSKYSFPIKAVNGLLMYIREYKELIMKFYEKSYSSIITL